MYLDHLPRLMSNSIQKAWEWTDGFAATEARPLIDLSQGSPASPPPPELLKALGASAADPESSKYTAPKGDATLVRAVIEEMKNVYGDDIDVQEPDVAITAGCNLAYFAALKTIADAGDEVIVPLPWCVFYLQRAFPSAHYIPQVFQSSVRLYLRSSPTFPST